MTVKTGAAEAVIHRPFVLLDRDGTILVEKNYLSHPRDVEFTKGAPEGLRLLQEHGYGLIVITNQSGIGRGYFNESDLASVHDAMSAQLRTRGVRLDAIYFCPHSPEDGCACRKPEPGLPDEAARDFRFEMKNCWIVGDKAADVALALRCGARAVRVRTGYGSMQLPDDPEPHHTSDNLWEAAKHIVRHDQSSPAKLTQAASERLRSHVRRSVETKEALLRESEGDVLRIAEIVTRALASGHKLMLCGNGGSAADCQHIASEFVSVLTQHFLRPGLPAIALTTDASILTASANDFGFEGVFARQVQALGAPGDVLIGISTSGNSPNVVNAVKYAREHGIHALGFSGESGGRMAEFCEVCLRAPSTVTQFIQESHIMAGHIVCDLAEQSLREAGLIVMQDVNRH